MTRKNRPTTMDKILARDREVKQFTEAGLIEYYDAGITSLSVARRFCDHGFTPAEAVEWRRVIHETDCNVLVKDCAEWKALGFTPAEAIEWSRNYTPQLAAGRRAAGYTPRKHVVLSSAAKAGRFM